MIKEIKEIVGLIVEAIQAHSAATQEIAAHISRTSIGVAHQRMGQTSAVAQNMARDTSGVNQTATEMVGASREIQWSARELSRVSDQLREVLAKYRYKNQSRIISQ